MALKVSTALRNKMLDTGALRTIMAGSFLKLYSGTVPSTADDAISGDSTLLCTISNGGSGVTFAATAAGGVIAKNASETWTGVNGAAGVATYYRLVTASDNGLADSSAAQARVQGTIALAGADMNFTSTSLSNGATQTIDYFVLALTTL